MTGSPRLRTGAAAAALVLATILAYLPALDAGFLWDDDAYVTHNLAVRSPDGLARIWLEPWASPQYYPVTLSSFWLEYRLWGQAPRGYHLTNVLLHAASAVLVWRILRRLAVPGAWVASAFFALHPVHVESVAWITERKNVLSGLFFLLSLLAWLSFSPLVEAKRGNPRFWAPSFLLFLCALGSKTVTGSLPAVLLLLSFWKRGRIVARDALALVPFFAAGAAMGSLTGWLEKHRVGAWGPDWDLSFVERLLVAGRAVWFYAGKLVWPAGLSFVYPRWEIDASAASQWLWPLAAIATLAALWLARGALGRGPLTAVLYFGGALFPALSFVNVFPMLYSFVADHFQYLASLGLLSLAAAGAASGIRRTLGETKRARGVGAALSLLALSMLAAATWSRASVYRDQETLWRDTIRKNPGAWMARANLASLLHASAPQSSDPAARERMLAEAEQEYLASLSLRPGNSPARMNLAHLYEERGLTDLAEKEFATAAAQPNRYPPGSRGFLQAGDAWYHYARFLADHARLAEAQDAYRRAIGINPGIRDGSHGPRNAPRADREVARGQGRAGRGAAHRSRLGPGAEQPRDASRERGEARRRGGSVGARASRRPRKRRGSQQLWKRLAFARPGRRRHPALLSRPGADAELPPGPTEPRGRPQTSGIEEASISPLGPLRRNPLEPPQAHDLSCDLLDRHVRDVEAPPTAPLHLVARFEDLARDGPAVEIALHRCGRAREVLHPDLAHRHQAHHVDSKPDHSRRLELEELRRRIHAGNQRNVRRLDPFVGEVEAGRALRCAGDPHEDHVGPIQIVDVLPVVVLQGEVDRLLPVEPLPLRSVEQARRRMRRLLEHVVKGREGGAQHVHGGHQQSTRALLHRSTGFLADQRVEDHRADLSRLLHDAPHPVFGPHLRPAHDLVRVVVELNERRLQDLGTCFAPSVGDDVDDRTSFAHHRLERQRPESQRIPAIAIRIAPPSKLGSSVPPVKTPRLSRTGACRLTFPLAKIDFSVPLSCRRGIVRALADSGSRRLGPDWPCGTRGGWTAQMQRRIGTGWTRQHGADRGRAVPRILALAGALLVAPLIQAAGFAVNSTVDAVDANPGNGTCATAGGVCTLRAAIQEANALAGADTITMPAGTFTLTRPAGDDTATNGDLDLTADVTIQGAGARLTIVDGGAIDRVFDVIGGTAAISSLTIANGDGGGNAGGGVRNSATVTLTDVAVTGCRGKDGGGVFNNGTATLVRVTLSGNTASSAGGGIESTGGGPLNFLTNVTISGNAASNNGGGLELDHGVLTNVTVSGNTCAGCEGLSDRGGQPFTMKNVIVAGNTGTSQCSGSPASLGGNLASDASCSLTGPGDLPSTNPSLGPLQDNGGPTNTHALPSGSPAVDAGLGAGAPATDQRGIARPKDGNGDSIAVVDIGAFELDPSANLSLTKTDNPDPAASGGELLYNLLITNNGPSTATNVTLTDVLPASVTLVSAIPSQGSCSGTTTVTCNLGAILNAGTASVGILVVTSGSGSITNNASVTATEPDPVPANNSASASTTVVVGGTTDIPLTLYRRIHGFIDSTVTGGTLRTQPNTGNPCLVGASSTAALAGIPVTATVAGAYLYWGGSGSTIDSSVTLDAAPLAADRTFSGRYALGGTNYDYFGGFKDVTAYVQGKRNGNYTFGGLTVDTANPYCSLQAVLAGWALIVVYQDSSATGKTVVLYDGFDIARNESTAYVLAGIYASPRRRERQRFSCGKETKR